jgi:hypothetical protein
MVGGEAARIVQVNDRAVAVDEGTDLTLVKTP